jgi:hypothetical protein
MKMSRTLQRRVSQLERRVELLASLDKPHEIVRLNTPESSAPVQEVEAFRLAVSEAVLRGAFVVVLRPSVSSVAMESSDQVRVVREEWEAHMEVLGRTPSKTRVRGKTALSDVIDSLSGNVHLPVPSEGLDQPIDSFDEL